MMKDYKLIFFYNRGTSIRPSWDVYAAKSNHDNDLLFTFLTKTQAIEYAHGIHGLPVIQGTGNSAEVVKILNAL